MSSLGIQPSATPAYILRGHPTPIHALHFFRHNAVLASGDADGWIVVWSLASRRAVAVWKAHEGSILGVGHWGSGRLITHGRDHKLRVWQLGAEDFEGLDTRLPVEQEGREKEADGAGKGIGKREPWLLHSMPVNALNFCAFAMCYNSEDDKNTGRVTDDVLPASTDRDDYQVAGNGATATLTPKVALPVIVAVPNALDSGGIDFFHLPSEHRVSTLQADKDVKTGMVMTLSLFHHPVTRQLTVISGYEAGHAMVHVRKSPTSDVPHLWSWKKVLVSQPHSQPLLSLQVSPSKDNFFTSSADATLAKFSVPSNSGSSVMEVEQKPVKILNTKHAGQQGLCVRSDGRILATAGWDARVRVYSAKTMKELAVLKWHEDGCYAVDFAQVDPVLDMEDDMKELSTGAVVAAVGGSALNAIKRQRSEKAQTTHWLAAGGKDGKISLWDLY